MKYFQKGFLIKFHGIIINLRIHQKGFTLVEIMIVVAIIALLAAIAIPNLLRAKVAANESAALATLKTLSTAAETYVISNSGNYPTAEASLRGPTPPYINKQLCATTLSGFGMVCNFDSGGGGYTYTATPTSTQTGTRTFTMSTGGVLSGKNL